MAAVARSDGGSSSRRQHRVALFTAYTSDYTLGELCARVNRAYACRHRYGWICQVREARSGGADLAARHPTWDKVQLVLELMEGLLDGGSPHGLCPRTTHLMWIDADAVVLRQDRRVEEILDSLPDGEVVHSRGRVQMGGSSDGRPLAAVPQVSSSSSARMCRGRA
eukprot:scaffold92166_cov30-Tisochrysis_lutea.AAC.3